MAHYRLYKLGPEGRFISVVELDCEDDQSAIKRAETVLERDDFELWSLNRLVFSRRKSPPRIP
jgi:hypothetical protein